MTKLALNLCLAFIAVSMLAWGCGDDGGGGGAGGAGGAGATGGSGGLGPPGDFGFVMGDEGSDLTLRRPDGTEEAIDGQVILGWINGQLLEGNYFKQLRIGTDVGTIELRLSFPGDAPPTGLIEGIHQLRGTRLLLEDTQVLDEVQAEVYFQSSDLPLEGLTNAVGTVEIFLEVNTALAVYDIAGEIRADISGTDGTYGIEGFFWAREIDP